MLERLILLPMVVALALALAGCSDLGRPVRLQARGEVSATALDFGTIAVADSATRRFTLRNSGSLALVGEVGLSCAGFRVIAGGGPFRLAPRDTLGVAVRFTPAAVGAYSCVLDLGPDSPHVTLAGTAALQAPGAQSLVTPLSLDLGVVAVGQASYREFKVFSVGTAPLLVNVVSPCGEFVPILGGGPAVIAPGDSMVVRVLFSPLSGGDHGCAIAVGPGCPEVAVAGSATSVSFAQDIRAGIFDTHGCTTCHGWSYALLVGRTSSGYAPAVLVVPFDTTNSVLYGKVTNSGRFGGGMPQPGYPPLTLPERIELATWILEGARDN